MFACIYYAVSQSSFSKQELLKTCCKCLDLQLKIFDL